MNASDFAHLHVHSHFSLLEAHCRIPELVAAVAEAGQEAVALTDNGNLFGAPAFQKAAKAQGIKPILGIDAYVSPFERQRRARDFREGHKRPHYRMVLLAETQEGWDNLIELSTIGYLEGFYYKPRIDREVMAQHGKGLIALSGSLGGEVAQSLLLERYEEAIETVSFYQEVFGKENYFLELVDHGMEEQKKLIPMLERLSEKTGAPLIASNDVHYVRQEDWKAQDVAQCIGSGRLESDPTRFRFSSQELFLKSTGEMEFLWKGQEDALRRTKAIADRCSAELDFGNRYLPSFSPPDQLSSEEYFIQLCRAGVERKYDEITPEVEERLRMETEVIVNMGFVDYFLITWDFIRHAREQGIPVGPGRGSAAGSIIAYSLDITMLDPIKYDLLFERFLNSQRVSMPDIDIDFCKDRRSEVIQYVEEKYGRNHVAQIITFGTLKARAVIRDVGRALDVPLPEVDRIAKKIPNGPKDTLASAVEGDAEVKELYEESEANKRLFDISLKLEGCARHASIHAAGVIVTDRPLVERVPLYKNGEDITSQWPMDILEEVGLLKMDFLGLRTLTIINEACRNIGYTTGTKLDIDSIPLDDKKSYDMLTRGDACGIFQLESEGMRELLKRLKPDRFDDIIAVLALYRPGPLGSGMVDAYVRRKHGEEEITYLHPILEPILSESLGVILYQEQVMRIANLLAGFSLNEADNLRKAMGKKKPEILAKFKDQFVEGAKNTHDVDPAISGEVFDLIEFFAGYGFNKSHSAAYALVTYQTAYLKANYPVEYMAGLLTCEMISIEKTVEYVSESRKMGIEVLPPDVNHSRERFVVDEGRIRFALTAIKGVGEAPAKSIVAAREQVKGDFRSLFELCEHVDTRLANKSTMEALIWAGALDTLPLNRRQKCAILEEALAMGTAAEKDRRSGQGSLFGGDDLEAELLEAEEAKVPDLPDFEESERLQNEKAVLGFYLSGHPLDEHRTMIESRITHSIRKLDKLAEGTKVTIGGMIEGVRVVTIKNGRNAGQKMAIVKFEDFDGSIEGVVFSDLYLKLVDQLKTDTICFLKGEVDKRRDTTSFKISEMITLEDAKLQLATELRIRLADKDEIDIVVSALHRILKSHPGKLPVIFGLETQELGIVSVRTSSEFQVRPTSDLIRELQTVLGEDRITLN